MTTINRGTKKADSMINRARYNEGFFLSDVYGRYSTEKERAWRDCMKWYLMEGGSNFRIISHNTFGFSVAWDVPDGVRIETPQNSYKVLV